MLKTIWLCMLISGSLLLIISVALIFVFKIPDLLDELSGRKAKRQIKRLKELNVGTGALGDMATDDIYNALPTSGTLLEETVVEDSNGNDVEKHIISYSSDVEEGKTTDAEEDEDSETNIIQESEQEEATSFIEEDERQDEGTTCIEDEIDTGNEVSDVLKDIKIYSSNKQVIEVLEEQTSL